MSKHKLSDLPNIPEEHITKEWYKWLYDLWRTVYGNGDSIFGKIKELKTELKEDVKKLSGRIEFTHEVIDTYIKAENEYQVKYLESQQKLRSTRTRWAVSLIVGAILSIAGIIVSRLI